MIHERRLTRALAESDAGVTRARNESSAPRLFTSHAEENCGRISELCRIIHTTTSYKLLLSGFHSSSADDACRASGAPVLLSLSGASCRRRRRRRRRRCPLSAAELGGREDAAALFFSQVSPRLDRPPQVAHLEHPWAQAVAHPAQPHLVHSHSVHFIFIGHAHVPFAQPQDASQPQPAIVVVVNRVRVSVNRAGFSVRNRVGASVAFS